MPTYDYECRECGGFDALRSVSLAQMLPPVSDNPGKRSINAALVS